MRKALVSLASAAALGALACATPAAAMGGDATEEQGQAQLHPNQPEQAPEAAPYGVPKGKVYYAQAPSGGYVEAPSGGYVQAPPPSAGAIEPPSGAFMQTLGAVFGGSFEILTTPYIELFGGPAP
jgi:hypothetical protein